MGINDPIPAAYAHHLAGRRVEAEGILRRVLEREPHDAGALHLLGVMAQAQGRPASAPSGWGRGLPGQQVAGERP